MGIPIDITSDTVPNAKHCEKSWECEFPLETIIPAKNAIKRTGQM
jgi:hypothetical protein